MRPYYHDRTDAGRRLAAKLQQYAGRDDVIVLALPRGGVPVAFEVARALRAPLDILVVRKLGLPQRSELAMGAVASGGIRLVDTEIVRHFGVSESDVAAVIAAEEQELVRRERLYRGGRPFPDVRGKIVILVDDGLATGATMAAAAAALKRQDPARLIVAVPVSSPETCDTFRNFVDDIVCAVTPEPFYAVGLWYEDFSQTTDDEVHDLLERARREADAHLRTAEGVQVRTEERTVHVAADHVRLEGAFAVPHGARGVVLFAHGSGSSRHSPRNRYVARELHAAGLATLLVDLLTADEEREDARMRHLRFDIGLLAGRLIRAIEWLAAQPETRALKVGLFGASTGGGAALVAAAQRPEAVGAVVSRGGRPDLAGDALPRVRAPTLLIVGGDDEHVIELNEEAMTRIRGPVRLEIIAGASHLFEEPGALERVAQLARGWFAQHLATQYARTARAQDVRSMGGDAPRELPS